MKGHQAFSKPEVPIPPRAPVPSINNVLAPSRAAAVAAAHPEGPPPTTITSQLSYTGIFDLPGKKLLLGVSAANGVPIATDAKPKELMSFKKFLLFINYQPGFCSNNLFASNSVTGIGNK